MNGSRADQADAYHGRYFSRPNGEGLMRVLRGATGAVLRTIYPDGHMGLTDPDEMDAHLRDGLLVERHDVLPPDGSES